MLRHLPELGEGKRAIYIQVILSSNILTSAISAAILQFHLACIGLIPSDIDVIQNWSCPTCKEKWKLQLSPSRSPKKKRRRGDE